MKFDIIKNKMGGTLQLLQGSWTHMYIWGIIYENFKCSFFFFSFQNERNYSEIKKKKREYGVGTL